MKMSGGYWKHNLHIDNSSILSLIKDEARHISGTVNLMEVCGGHTNTIMRYGIRQALPDNIRLVSGPGCPVCVTSQKEIDSMIEMALQGVPVASYGDMMRVPGSKLSLDEARAQGADVKMVYSAAEVLKLKEKHPDVVFFGIGFETTAPMTAFLLKNKVAVYSAHKVLVPGLKALLDQGVNIDGFILPGHVSAIIGTKPYSAVRLPMAVAGFEPEHVLRSVYALASMIRKKSPRLVNAYPEIVKEQGNSRAIAMIKEQFEPCEAEWRGIGWIPDSGLAVRDSKLDAKELYKDIIAKVPKPKKTGCRCGDVLRGMLSPRDCPLFGKSCNPQKPVGACMVSSEGACQVLFRYSE